MRTIFISLDTVCADRLSILGCSRSVTPNLDAFARESAFFTQAYASDIPTQPSHTALFTGRYGLSTGIVSHFHPPARLDEGVAWLPSVFQARGRRTAAVDHLFSMKEWFIRGYDDYMVPPGRSRSPASVINDMGMDWLDRNHGRDFFLFLHYWDAHIPYLPPEPFKSALAPLSEYQPDPLVECKLRSRPSYSLFKQNLYDHLDSIPSLEYIEALHYAELAYLDSELGRLFDHLDGLGVLDDSLVVVFGDHGEVMTEHDSWFDHAGLYDSVVHVPLMIRAPGLIRPSRIDTMVSLVDVMPTVLELQGLTPASGRWVVDGWSLTDLMDGSAKEHRPYVILSECTWQAKRGVRTPEWKYIRCWDPGIYPRTESELYFLPGDPNEQRNVADDHPRVASELDAVLDRWMAEQMAGRRDPMLEVMEWGLPAVARLRSVMGEGALAVGAAALSPLPASR